MFRKLFLPLLLLTPVTDLLCAQQELPYRLQHFSENKWDDNPLTVYNLDEELAEQPSVAPAIALCFLIIDRGAHIWETGKTLTKPFVFEKLHAYLRTKSSDEINATPAFIEACRLNNFETLLLLLSQGADSNVIDFDHRSTALTTLINLPLAETADDPLANNDFLQSLTLLLSTVSPEVVAFINEHFSLCTLLGQVIAHCSSEEQAKGSIEIFKAKGFQQNPALDNEKLFERATLSAKILPLLEKTLGSPVIINKSDQEKLRLIKKLLKTKSDYAEIYKFDTQIKESTKSKIKYILQSGFDLNTRDEDDNTLLHYLVGEGSVKRALTFAGPGEDYHQLSNMNKIGTDEIKKYVLNLILKTRTIINQKTL